MVDLDLGYLGRIRDQELHEGSVAKLAVLAVGEPLVKRSGDALRHAALDLTLHDQRVDDPAAVMNDYVFENLQPVRLGIDPHVSGVTA